MPRKRKVEKKKAVKKKVKIKKVLGMPKLPDNSSYWLHNTKDKETIIEFADRGDDLQRKSMKSVIEYRLWQIQEGKIDKYFFGDLDVKKLDLNVVTKKRGPKKGFKGKPVKVVKNKTKKPIDLFDFGNIKDLTKEK